MNDEQLIWEAYSNMGIHIRDDKLHDFTGQIIRGEKTIETKFKPTLNQYIGQRVGIIRTGTSKGTPAKSYLVGSAIIAKPVVYHNEEEFDKDYDKHLVDKNSEYYIKHGTIKYGYPLIDVKRIEPAVELILTDRKGFTFTSRPIDHEL